MVILELERDGSRRLHNIYFLSQILNVKVLWKNQHIGNLSDVIIVDAGKLAEVTHFVISRPFGRPALVVPLDKIESMDAKQIIISIENLEAYQNPLKPEDILLKDHILDKKVLDIEDREVEVVYDVKMTLINNKLFVTDVDLSKYGLLRRMGLKWLADIIYRPKEYSNKEIIAWTYIQPLPDEISSFKGDIKLNILKERLGDMDPIDLADVLEELEPKQRAALFGELDTEHASDTLEEIDPSVQRELVASLKIERAAQLVGQMTPAQAADVLSVLPADLAENILSLFDKKKAEKINLIIQQQDVKVFDLATAEFLKFDPKITVAQTEEDYPKLSRGKDVIDYLYITDVDDKLLGIVGLKDLLLADDASTLGEIMDENIHGLSPEDTLKEAAELFKRYDYDALPVLDDQKKILGVLPYRDIMNLKHKFV